MGDIERAAERIRGVAVRTPLLPTLWGDAARPLWLKPESLQPVGSFKIRGATNKVASLPPHERARGLVAHSSGNHAQAVAYAARSAGVPALVVMPDAASPVKIAATRALGAEVVLVPPADRDTAAERLAAERGGVLVPPYDDPEVIAGQGTVGLEIVEDLSDVDTVLVPVSGGGLISGVATAVKARRPQTVVLGVEPELAADAAESLRTGERVEWSPADTYRTAADGLRTTSVGRLPWEHIRRFVDGILTVSEDEIAAAGRALALRSRLVAEPSGAVTSAAYLFHAADLPTGRTVAVVSGGNAEPALLGRWLA